MRKEPNMTTPALPASGAPTVDTDTYIQSMGNVCKTVTVVSATTSDSDPYGTTVSAFGGLSLDPPLVTVALDRGSVLLSHLQRGARVGVNILAHHQADLAQKFAKSRPDKFRDTSWTWDHGLPRLAGIATWIACDIDQMVEGGDHVIVIGRVVHAETTDAAPLVYARRVFGTHSEFIAPGS
jgi:flavin reductase (DIM6/NTAB) family NADH-FMN oxidoreductase RutF